MAQKKATNDDSLLFIVRLCYAIIFSAEYREVLVVVGVQEE